MRRLYPFAIFCALLTLAGCPVTAPPVRTVPPRDKPAPGAPAAGGAPAGGGAPAAPPAARGGAWIVLGSSNGRPGDTITIAARLDTGGAAIAGTQNDILFDPKQLAIAERANHRPDCAANGQIGKEGTAFSFLPKGCKAGPGGNCTMVRALVLSLSNVDAIPTGSTLYTCRVVIAPTATPGVHALALGQVAFSGPTGQSISGNGGDGAVTVGSH